MSALRRNPSHVKPRSFKHRLPQSRAIDQQRRALLFESLENRLLLATWQNPWNRLDVDGDGLVAPIDALGAINELNGRTLIGPRGELPSRDEHLDRPTWDTDGDGYLAPVDVLPIINALNGDVAPPTIVGALGHDTAPDGELNSDGITFDPVVLGRVADDLTGVFALRVQIDNGPSTELNFDRHGGDFVFDPGWPRDGSVDGKHVFHFSAIDGRSNTSSTFDIALTLDTQPPTVSVASPTTHVLTHDNVSVAGRVGDVTAGFAELRAQIDDNDPMTVAPGATGDFTFVTRLLLDGTRDGEHSVCLTASDKAGNVFRGSDASCADVTFTLKATAPTESPLPPAIAGKLDERIWQAAEDPSSVRGDDGVRIDDQGDIQSYIYAAGELAPLLTQLADRGIPIETYNEAMGVIQAWVPASHVAEVAAIGDVRNVTLPDYAVVNTGAVNSAGDVLIYADRVRSQFAAFGIDGSGIKIGVISDGADHRANSQATDDLPTNITIDPSRPGKGDEGTAMLEIVHDLAPGAQLYFSGPSSSLDMINSIYWLAGQGVDVIVDDLGFLGEPYFADGNVAQAAIDAIDAGITYVTSSGNWSIPAGYYGRTHYQHAFVNNGAGFHDFLDGAGADLSRNMVVDAGKSLSVILQWSDPYGGSRNNYDLRLYDNAFTTILAQSAIVQNGTTQPYPFEALTWTNTTTSRQFVNVAVVRMSGEDRELELFTNSTSGGTGALEYVTQADSIFGHAAVPRVISVGAISASDSGADTIESFSSQGPSTIYTDFTSQTKILRQSLDGAAIDGVETKTGQLGFFGNPFYGTSAAAPHAAALAALILDANPALTPAEVAAILADTAVDLTAYGAGYDNVSGSGRFNGLDAVYKAFKPAATDLVDGSDSGVSSSDNLTNDSTPTFSGIVPLASFVRLYVDGVEKGTQQLAADQGVYSITTSSLADGPHDVTIRVASSSSVSSANLSQPSDKTTITVDTAAPNSASFVRQSPLSSPTNADTLIFRATFSESVTGVDPSDFSVSGTTATLGITAISASQYEVTVTGGDLANLNGIVELNLAATAVIADLAGNAVPRVEPSIDEKYVVDNTAPTTASFARFNPASSPTNADTLVFRAMFSEAVVGVDATDFTVAGTTASLSVTAFSATQYDVAVSGGDLSSLNGAVELNLAATAVIADLAGNALPRVEPTIDEKYVVDNTAPTTVSFARLTPASSPTNADTLVFRATFSEAVVGVDATDFAVAGTSASISVTAFSATQYDVTVSGGDLASLNGTVEFNLSATAVIADLAGNALPRVEPTIDERYVVDNTAPTTASFVRFNPASSPTNADMLVFRATFSEAVVGVDATDFAVAGTTASLGVTAFSATQYDVAISGGDLASLNGAVELNLSATAVIADPAGNALPRVEPTIDEKYVVDNTAPTTVSFARLTPASSPTNADTLVFRATFSEAVVGVDATDFAVAGTSASISLTAFSATQYDVAVIGGDLASLNGAVELNLSAAAVIADPAGNALPRVEPSIDEKYVVDNTAPTTVSFARLTPASSPTNADTLVFRASFNEAVVGVDATDFAVAGTSASISLTAFSATQYDVTVSGGDLASLNGTVELNLSATAVIADPAGNALPRVEPSIDEKYVVDNTAPTTVSFARLTPASSPTNADTLVFRATFSEAVVGVDATDFAVAGTSASISVTAFSATQYDVTVSGGDLASLNGTVELNLSATAVISDPAANALPRVEPSIDEKYVVDNTTPTTVSFVRFIPATSPTNADTLVFRATFNEAVVGVDVSDFAFAGTTASLSVTAFSATQFDVTATGGDLANVNGVVELNLSAAAVIADLAGNALPKVEPSIDEKYVVDNTAPTTVSFARLIPASSPTNADTLVFRASFNEAVVGVDATDFAVAGTSASISLTAFSATQYDVTVSGGDLASLNGTVELNLSATVVIADPAGNALPRVEPSIDEKYVVDNTVPTTVSFARLTPVSSPTNADTLVFRATFSEVVVGVDATDFAVAGTSASISVTAFSATQYDVTVSGGDLASLNGVVELNLSAAAEIADLAGNALPKVEPSIDEKYVVDNTAPTTVSFARLTPVSSPTNADTLVFRATFGEAVVGVDATDFAVAGTTATLSVSAFSATMYDVAVSGGDLADLDGTVELNLSAVAVVKDLAGNALPKVEPSIDEKYVVDNTAPTTVSFARLTPASSPTNADTLVFRATFGEAVVGVDATDFAVAGTTASLSVTAFSTTQFDVTVTGGDLANLNGAVELNLSAAAAITDLAGNALPRVEPAIDEKYIVDNTAPGTVSFKRFNPTASATNADTLVFRATFSEAVVGVDATDFGVSGTTASLSVAAFSTREFDVTVAGGNLANLNAVVGLNLSTTVAIVDVAGNGLPSSEPTIDEEYTVVNVNPSLLSFARQMPTSNTTNADTLVFRATFDRAVSGVDASDFIVSGTSASVAGVAQVNSSIYDLTVAGGDLAALNGVVGINLSSSQNIVDSLGNPLPNEEPTIDETYAVDNTAPSTASFSRRTPVAAFTNSDTLVFRVTFSEPVADVDANDFTVNGTTATSSVTVVSQTQYDITLSGGNLAALDGVVDLNFASSVSITDLAGNSLPSSEPATDESYTVDNTSPATTSFTRQFPTSVNTNADTLVFRATFNEPVSGVDASDFSLSGTTATISVSASSSTRYDITVTGGNLASLNAIVGLNFSTGASITDLAGNTLPRTEPTTDETFTVDNNAPVASSFVRQNPTTSPTSADTLVFRVTFNEAMTGVDATDFVAAGTTAALTVAPVSGSQYDVTLAGGNLANLNGTVGLNFAPSAALSDLAGNPLTSGEPATDETYTVDNGAPATSSFARRTPSSLFTNADALVFRATFNEAVTGVDANDFTVSGTTAAWSVLVVSGTQYDITVTGGNLAALNGVVGLDFAANVSITDLAGNPLPNSEPTIDDTFTVDNTAPATLSFARQFPTSGNTNSDTLVFRATFNEAVSGVDASDFSLSGTTASLSVSASSSTQFDITVTGGNLANLNATVGLNFSAGANIADLAGNALPRTEPTTDETFIVDNTAPSASSFVRQNPTSSPTNADTLVFRVTFNEAVTGVDANDFAASGTTASLAVATVSATQYDVTLAGGNLASLDGTVGLNFAASMAITDLAGNVLPAGEPPTDQTYIVDNTGPTTTSFARRTPASTPTNADTLVFRVTFSEAVTGVDVADFAVAGTTASASVSTVSGTQYDVTITGGNLASLNGVVGLNFAAGVTITDSAGNALPGTEPPTDETFTVDNAAPSTVSFARRTPTTSPTNADSLVFRVTFDEAVTGVDVGDFALAGTTATLSVTTVSATQYDLTASGGNLASLNATVGLNFATSISISDSAGNALPRTEPATDETYIVDNTAPAANSFVRQSPASSPTNADSLVFRVTFSEAMTGVDATDFVASGTTASLTVTAVSTSQYDVTLSGGNLAGLDGTVGLNFAASAALSDLAGNALPAGEPPTDETYVVDNTAPATSSFARKTPTSANTNADTLVFRVTFNEGVTGVDLNDFTISGTTATLSVATVSTTQYDVTVTGGNLAGLNATVGLDFAASISIADLAGNALPRTEPATDETYVVDNTIPTADIVDVSPDPRTTTVGIVTVNFSEAVTGVDIADFTLTRDGNSVSLSALSVSGSGDSRTLDLSTVTAVAGSYVLTLKASGSNIADLATNALAADASDSFQINIVASFNVTETGGGTVVSETGTTDFFTVVLGERPGSDVVLALASGDSTEATVSPASLTFTSANWNVPRTVQVTGVNDNLRDGNQSSTITVSVVDAQSDDAFDPLADKTVVVATVDNDIPVVATPTNIDDPTGLVANDQLGYSVAIDGDYAVAGAPNDYSGNPNGITGAAYVYHRENGVWKVQQKITPSGGADKFGNSVAISGDTVVVGAFKDSTNSFFQGAAFVFVRSGSTWTQQQKLTASDGGSIDLFGAFVAIQGDTLVVAASDDDYGVVGNSNTVGVHDQGSAYVFTRSGGAWTQRAHLLDAGLPAKSYYGQSVSISGDTIAIASALQGDGNTISAAYIYTGSADSWSLQQKVQLSHPVRDGNGYDLTVALSGNRLALGNFTVNSDQGEVRMFQRSGATWSEAAALTASDGAAGDRFGVALSLDDDWLMVGAPWDDVGGNANQGGAYLFRLTDSNWRLVDRISPAAAAGDQVGLSVAINSRNIFVGAPFTDMSGTTDRGKVYSYRATEIPNITSITPPIAAAGDTVVIRGSGFSATAGDNFVSFGPVRAAVTNASETQLTVTVPQGSTYGSVGVQVAGRTGYSQQYFTPRSAGNETLSSSSFAASTAISGGYAGWHGVGDIDGDGRVDIVTSNYDDYVWKVYRNVLTQGSLAADASFPTGTLAAPVATSVGFGPIGGGLGDFDGDGRLDFVFCDYRAGNSVSVYRNTSSPGNITFGSRQSFGAGASSEQLTVADVDGDGRLDIIVANGGYPGTDNRISVLRNRSVLGGAIDFDAPVFYTVVDRPYSVGAGDLNGDGKPEIIAGGQSSQSISILTNQSASPGDVAFGNRIDYSQSRDIYSILPTDIDRDGKLDLVLGSYSYSSTTVLYNKVANGTIDANSFATKYSIATSLAMPYGSVGDLNGTDAVDLAFGNTSNSTLTLMVNGSPVSGDPPISFTSFGVSSGQDRPALTSIIDIDGDGRNDVVTSSANGRQITLSRSIIDPHTAAIGSRVWRDQDGDGIQDVGEPGLAGAVVELLSAGADAQIGGGDDFSLGTRVTDADGQYLFNGLAANTYYLEFRLPVGFAFASSDVGADDAVDSDANTSSGRTGVFAVAHAQADMSRDAGATGAAPAFGWAFRVGKGSEDEATAITTDAAGNIYVTGSFDSAVDFDPGPGSTILVSNSFDVFVAKYSPAGALVWARMFTGGSDDWGLALDVDSVGNVYTTGYFQATVDFDPGAGEFLLTRAGGRDLFVSKLNRDGGFVYAKALGGTANDQGQSLVVDSQDNVIVGGTFSQSMDFDPGAGVVNRTSAGGTDAFVLKLDSSGALLWADTLGGAGDDVVSELAIGAADRVAVTGAFQGSVDFDPGASQDVHASLGGLDAFVLILNSSGGLSWTETFGSSTDDEARSVAFDTAGNVVVAGSFTQTVDFDVRPAPFTALLASAGGVDAFLLKLDSTGQFIWTRGFGGAANDAAYGTAIDSHNVISITGKFEGTADFDPTNGVFNIASGGSRDAFIASVNSQGAFVGANGIGVADADQGVGIAVDADDNVYFTGYFGSTVDFDPTAGVFNLVSFGGSRDAFVARYTTQQLTGAHGRDRDTAIAPPLDVSSGAEDITAVVSRAISVWANQTHSREITRILQSVHVRFADLEGVTLGLASRDFVILDRDAGGFGWFIDQSPEESSEFVVGAAGAMRADFGGLVGRRFDMLSVLVHEFGHILGLEHEHDSSSVMNEALTPGERRIDVPQAASLLPPTFTLAVQSAGDGKAIAVRPRGSDNVRHSIEEAKVLGPHVASRARSRDLIFATMTELQRSLGVTAGKNSMQALVPPHRGKLPELDASLVDGLFFDGL